MKSNDWVEIRRYVEQRLLQFGLGTGGGTSLKNIVIKMIIDGLLPHASTHENGGTDEINVAGLSGQLADVQKPEVNFGSEPASPYAGMLWVIE